MSEMTNRVTMVGMNNRTRAERTPDGMARNAVNVQFDDTGAILIPRSGYTLAHAGDVHSLYHTDAFDLFVEDGTLKVLTPEAITATTLMTGVGNSPMGYTDADNGSIYFANEHVTGKTDGENASEWGTARPPRQPTCTPVTFGGMFAGDYRVAITWIADEESGTGMGARVTVPDGGGIHLTNFPPPPDYVDKVAVWVSSVNSKDMYLYAEYGADTSDVSIGRLTPTGVIPTVPLQTQLGFPPAPRGIIQSHYGRIYYARGPKLYWTAIRRFGLQFANSYWSFDSDIQVVVSCSNVLYVGTEKVLYRITNIDGDGPAIRGSELDCGAVKGSESYDPDGNNAYFMSGRGFIRATSEGLTELTYDRVAMPFFEKGSTSVIERDGIKYLIGVFQNGTQNPLADSAHNAAELLRGSL
jgi:hypothetical protein